MDFISILTSIGAFAVAIGVLVTIHEFGHYWVARKMGVKVLRFSVGFGKPLLTKRMGEDQTEYVLASIPLGGYVKMLDEREGEVDPAELDRSFNRKNVYKRFAIVAAGPFFNFLFAIVAYYLIFIAGVGGIKPVIGEVSAPGPAHSAGIMERDQILSVNGIETPSWEKARFIMLQEAVGEDRLVLKVQSEGLQIEEKTIDISNLGLLKEDQIDLMGELGMKAWRPDIPPVIDMVIAGGAAESAGIQPGDKIISLDGVSISNIDQWIELIRANPLQTMSLVVNRNGEMTTLTITPNQKQADGEVYGFIGVQNVIEIPQEIRDKMTVTERYGPVAALFESLDRHRRRCQALFRRS